MIFGIGIDIVELHRIENMLSRQARFPQRILTEAEYARFTLLSDKRKIEFLAGRFAAKEAFSKAYGTGIGKELSFQDIETGNDTAGKPVLAPSWTARRFTSPLPIQKNTPRHRS